MRDFLPLALIATGIALVLSACGSSVRMAVVEIEPAPHWCFVAAVKDPRGKRAVGCFDTRRLCSRARQQAKRWGGMAGVQTVGPCERWALQ